MPHNTSPNFRGRVLSDHVQWELSYWREHARRAESVTRDDLRGSREDLRVTEIRIDNNEGTQTVIYMIGLASKEGVFALAISPAEKSIDSLVRDIVGSFKLVQRKLDADETSRVVSEIRAGK